MFGVQQPTNGFFMFNPWSIAALRVDSKQLYAYKRGILGLNGPCSLKIDMSVDEDIEC